MSGARRPRLRREHNRPNFEPQSGLSPRLGASALQELACIALLSLCGALMQSSIMQAQQRQEPGRSVGKISVEGNLIVMELDEGVLGKANLFDLARHTLRFVPDRQGYRVENVPLRWDADLGAALNGSQ